MASGDDEDPTSGGTPRYDERRVPAYRAAEGGAGGGAEEGAVGPDGTRILPAHADGSPPRASTSARVRASDEGGDRGADPAEARRGSVLADGAPRSSSEMAARSSKERRRERDARAEKAATRALVGIFLGVGALAVAVVGSGILDDAPPPAPAGVTGASGAAVAVAPAPPRPTLKSRPDETPDIPAIRSLSSTGLTIAAEGLPEVLAVDPANPPPLLAGIETCRFAYSVWELSPNKAFRFFTTCAAFQGQILVGAYEIEGSQIVMSPLRADGAELLSVFEVEKPSRMRTRVTIQPQASGPRVVFDVRQRITAMRPGMEGDGFYRTYVSKNDIEIAGVAKSREGPGGGGGAAPAPRGAPPPSSEAPPAREAPPPAGNDPVLELLKGGGGE